MKTTASSPSSNLPISPSSGASDPFSNDPEVETNESTKIDRIRVYVCLNALSTPPSQVPSTGEQQQAAQICIDLVVRTRSPSANAFRFRSGWLSHSTVTGVKKILFEGGEEVGDKLIRERSWRKGKWTAHYIKASERIGIIPPISHARSCPPNPPPLSRSVWPLGYNQARVQLQDTETNGFHDD